MIVKTRIQYENRSHAELGLETDIIWKEAYINLSQVGAVVNVEGEEDSDCSVCVGGQTFLIEMPFEAFVIHFKKSNNG